MPRKSVRGRPKVDVAPVEIRSESDSDVVSTPRSRRRNSRKPVLEIPVIGVDDELDEQTEEVEKNESKAPKTPTRRGRRKTVHETKGEEELTRVQSQTPTTRSKRDGKKEAMQIEVEKSNTRRSTCNAQQDSENKEIDPEKIIRGARGAKTGSKTATARSAKPPADVEMEDVGDAHDELAAEVARLRVRLYSTDASVALPTELDIALKAVSNVVLPSLGGRSAGSVVLLSGARGCGKSAVVTRLLHEVRSSKWDVTPVIVNLNGLLHGSSALSAFRAIARALGGSGEGHATHCLGEIGAHVAEVRERGAPLLFVLDEFHRFVHSTANAAAAGGHAQTALYSIFNLLQDTQLGAAAVCVTPHVDVSDHLEKRVKSRFSHRAVQVEVPANAEAVVSFVRTALSPPGHKLKSCAAVVDAFLRSDAFLKALNRQFLRDRTPRTVLDAIDASLLAPMDVSSGKAFGVAAARAFSEELGNSGSARDFVMGLATLELALLLALTRLERQNERSQLRFDDVYMEYEGLASGGQTTMLKTQMMHVEAKPIAAKAWERVVESGLVVCSAGGAGARHVTLGVAPAVVLDALKEHKSVGTMIQRWGLGLRVQ